MYLSGDLFQAAAAQHLMRVRPGRTVAAIARGIAPTASMQQTGESAPDHAALERAVRDQVGDDRCVFVDAQRIAEQVFAQNVLGNVVLLGAAFQLGGLPLSLADIEAGFQRRAATAANREAFEWGRWAAHDPPAVEAALAAAGAEQLTNGAFEPSARASAEALQLMAAMPTRPPDELSSHLLRRTAQVIDYQNSALGLRFLDLVLRSAERDRKDRDWALTRAVTESWFRLLTYKDEYEIARLHGAARYDLVARDLGIEGRYALRYHLHPPFLRRLGLKHKLALGFFYALGFMLLRAMKPLRGTIFDVFGWDRDRRLERAIIQEYRQLIQERVLADDAARYAAKVELAASALAIKGYGPIKERAIAAWRERIRTLSQAAASVSKESAE